MTLSLDETQGALPIQERCLWKHLVKQDPTLDALAADGALAHSVTTELASAVAAHEDHIL